ncbi:uncharacterized protein BCR38DRAFT_484316 [Pseudomassariella vexata]|uniref:Uncharacterized protein n=1 Tax=Pseudomassariella vexata TaxID=1141098 RepID=A0A1Y2DZX4_9PEZI|nr:uncharacterized protein BCR38DRAFT_484316 [Pseudomassariella vexata]ORY64840.1 hypothetical protein BCR38DRAFT_484316 [Pseudomassariella vexata]
MAVDFGLSPDGIESQLATNHLGQFLFPKFIMAEILESESPRVANASSDGHRFSPMRFGGYNFSWYANGLSKTTNILMDVSLAEKLGEHRGLLVFSLHAVVVLNHVGAHIEWTTDFSLPKYSSAI